MLELSHMPRIGKAVLKARLCKRTPLKITQYITYRCNLKCVFCGRRLIHSDEMTTKQIRKCMGEFQKMGTLYWGINGGEPLIRRDIGEVIAYAKDLNFTVSVSTNGALIPQRINEIKDVDMVLISIDGPEAIHDSMRGKGTYEKAAKSLEILRKHKIKTVIMTVLNKTNLAKLDHLLRLAEEYNYYIEFQPVVIHRSDIKQNAKRYFPLHNDLVQAIDWLMQQKNLGRPIANSFGYFEQMKNYPKPIDMNCWASRLVCVISPDGRVLPCAEMLSYEHNYKSGIKYGFKDAFDSLPDMLKCKECFFSCYGEYNAVLNKPFSSFIGIFKNITTNRWIWQ